ncbi:SWIB [Musa troglodytarum]|uniref:SWIB n=1 Tax=Musa troglodytarum TaxID=320322 RepID=A0A9E7GK46_9LILI|nr:SWIB [Musa troglodytarum]URE14518.1 SWIB [Musa troglodytarum]
MAASISFPTAFFSSDRAWAVSLPRRAVHLPGCLPPRRWLAAAASRVAAEAAPDASGKRRPRGITKSRPVSPELQAVVGEAEIPRTQALKKIWAYIKENNLQDPDNKRVIVCDEKLKKIFGGRDRVGFLEISGLLNPHFGK